MIELEVSINNTALDSQRASLLLRVFSFFLQSLDKENEILKGRLATLKDEMEDATEKMNEMTEELRSIQIRDAEYKGIYKISLQF